MTHFSRPSYLRRIDVNSGCLDKNYEVNELESVLFSGVTDVTIFFKFRGSHFATGSRFNMNVVMNDRVSFDNPFDIVGNVPKQIAVTCL
jgi:hypothetical protein